MDLQFLILLTLVSATAAVIAASATMISARISARPRDARPGPRR